MNKKVSGVLFFSIIFFIVDQALKIFISSNMTLNQTKILIKDFFNITLVHNTGAAFSILTGSKVLLILIGLVALIGVFMYLKQNDNITDMEVFIYSLLLGGILGNLVDRIVHGYVIDYIGLTFKDYHFPIFNFADICIVVSVILIFIITIREDLWK